MTERMGIYIASTNDAMEEKRDLFFHCTYQGKVERYRILNLSVDEGRRLFGKDLVEITDPLHKVVWTRKNPSLQVESA